MDTRTKEFLDRATDLAICGIMKTGITTSINDEEIPEGFSPVVVQIGISDNANVEIKEGLSEGEEVFTQMIRDSYWG